MRSRVLDGVRTACAGVLLIIGALCVLGSAKAWMDWREEQAALSGAAQDIVTGLHSDSERIIAVTRWVYRIPDFGKNTHSYVPRLGPSATDVWRYGGDCADRSRLEAGLLREVGIPSTLVMLYPCPNCDPTHTVVQARYENGWMVADPTYDLYFPDGPGKFDGIDELSARDDVVTDRLAQLRQQRGERDKIAYYDQKNDIYDYATTINWKKNVLTRAVASAIADYGLRPNTVSRPFVLEDPKLATALVLAFGAILSFCALVPLRWFTPGRPGRG